jgi:RNA polymerase sigma factor (sigma-70 family)
MALSDLIRRAREALEGKDLRRLVLDAQRGDNTARDELILGNLWLVELVARELCACPLSEEDRFSEGIFGLARAVELFDPAREVKFATYARHWIRHAIVRAGDDCGRTIRIAVGMVNRLRKVGKLEEAGTSDSEISERTGLSSEQLVRLRAAARLRNVQSLDAPLGVQEEEEAAERFTLEDALQSTWVRPDEFCQKEDLATVLREALDALDPVDRRIVEIVYGLGDRPRARTLGQAARMLRIEPVRAKEFMTRAMESLKQMLCPV